MTHPFKYAVLKREKENKEALRTDTGWSPVYNVKWKTQDSKPDVCYHLRFKYIYIYKRKKYNKD